VIQNCARLSSPLRFERRFVLVTHQVTITALTGVYPASGQRVLLAREPGTEPRVLGPITPRTP
jgi:hypothetical protein